MKLIRVTQATAVSLLLTAALAGCGGAGDDDTITDDPQAATFQGGPGGGPGGGATGGQAPGAFGTVAAVDGKTAQVQSDMNGQVAVSWTGDTTFTQQVEATLNDVQVGSCVLVTGEDTATSVRIMAECVEPEGMPTERPSDLPDDMSTDMPDGARPGGFGTMGEVTAVSSDGFTVAAMDSDVTVTVNDDTTYTKTADATADAVEVGVCVNAQGDSDDAGAVTATSISVSPPVDGECTGGFMMRGGRP